MLPPVHGSTQRVVKVLDFGLAKLGEYTSGASDPEAATLQVVQTDPGKIMGTAICLAQACVNYGYGPRLDTFSLRQLFQP